MLNSAVAVALKDYWFIDFILGDTPLVYARYINGSVLSYFVSICEYHLIKYREIILCSLPLYMGILYVVQYIPNHYLSIFCFTLYN